MVDFEGLIARVSEALDQAELPFMLIGGQAVLVHGDPRLTQDIDITLGVGPSELDRVREVCGTVGLEELPENVRSFVERTFVLPAAEDISGIRVDFIFSTTPYEGQAIARAIKLELAGREVPFASAEDLILHKLFAARPRDLDDARSVVRRKGHELDWEYLAHWAKQFVHVPGRETMPAEVRALHAELSDPAS